MSYLSSSVTTSPNHNLLDFLSRPPTRATSTFTSFSSSPSATTSNNSNLPLPMDLLIFAFSSLPVVPSSSSKAVISSTLSSYPLWSTLDFSSSFYFQPQYPHFQDPSRRSKSSRPSPWPSGTQSPSSSTPLLPPSASLASLDSISLSFPSSSSSSPMTMGAAVTTTANPSSSGTGTPLSNILNSVTTSSSTQNLQPSSDLSSSSSETETETELSSSSTPATPQSFYQHVRQYAHVFQYFLAGAVAGATSRTVVSPLERLKIIYQCQGIQGEYVGIFASLAKMWRDEGVRGFFRGNGVNVIRIAPYSAVQFTSYEQIKAFLILNNSTNSATHTSTYSELSTPKRLSAGALAGICSVVSTYPLDLVRSRLSIVSTTIGVRARSEKTKELGIVGMTVKVYKEEGGIRALYRGLIPTVVGVAPYVGLNFASYEALKTFFTPEGASRPSGIRKLACGALAGACSQTVTYPLDVLRRRMQVTGMDSLGFRYTSTWDAIRSIWITEGWKGFYRGLIPNLLKVAPAIGTSFVSYEFVKELLMDEEF